MLINLLGNAIKFTDKGSIILSVGLLAENNNEQKLKFEVADTGVGMSNEFITKIYDKFSQEYESTNRKYEGTGLGMAISNDLIELMGGKMTVVSKKNQGTSCSFIVSLPIGDPDSLISSSHQIKALAFKGMKALLVEDNDMNRFIALHSLDYLGFEITDAENGKVAIDILERETFDLIFMDIQMPVMDGVEATKYIRKKMKIDTPIIALTANAFKHDIDVYLSNGMNDFITKPYDEQDFFRKVEHVLRLKKTPISSNAEEEIKQATLLTENQDPLYDLSTLEYMSRGNQEFVDKMIRIFITLAREKTEVLKKALMENDLSTLQKTAHSIKPSIDQMGIASLKSVVRNIEKHDLNTGSEEELKSLVDHLTATLIKVVDELEK